MVWNFWPFDLHVWWPLKFSMNLFLFPFWFPTIPFYETWNVLPTLGGMVFWVFLIITLPLTFILFLFSGAFLVIQSWLYLSSLPDIFVIYMFLLCGGIAALLLYLFTGYKFVISEMPSWSGVIYFMNLFKIPTTTA